MTHGRCVLAVTARSYYQDHNDTLVIGTGMAPSHVGGMSIGSTIAQQVAMAAPAGRAVNVARVLIERSPDGWRRDALKARKSPSRWSPSRRQKTVLGGRGKDRQIRQLTRKIGDTIRYQSESGKCRVSLPLQRPRQATPGEHIGRNCGNSPWTFDFAQGGRYAWIDSHPVEGLSANA
jgi:hypothetical protein